MYALKIHSPKMLLMKLHLLVSRSLQDSICFAFFLTLCEYVEYWRIHEVTLKACLQLRGTLKFN